MHKIDPKYAMPSAVRAQLNMAAARIAAREAAAAAPPDIAKVLSAIPTIDPKKDGVQKLFGNVPERFVRELTELRHDYYEAVARGNPHKLKQVLDKGFPINFQNPETDETALHSLAAGGARAAIRVLLAHADCDFLIRDKQGRLASELAYLYGRDPALARLLGNKERKQAQAQGIKLTHRPA